MSDDLLERATRALREEGGKEPTPDQAALMRRRVLSQNKRRAQLRPQGMWQWAAVVCLGFFVSTAMAHVIKVQLPRVIEALRDEAPAPPPKAAAKRARLGKPKAVVPAAPEVQPAPEAPSDTAAVVEPQPAPTADAAPSAPSHPAPTANAAQHANPAPTVHASQPARVANAAPSTPPPARAPRPAKPRAVPKAPAPVPASTKTALAAVLPDDEPAPVPSAAPPSATPTKVPSAESAELALFRRAQELHLSHDPKAIDAWDAYLRVASTSALAPEARYNRALGLVRANRFSEAKSALAPFAEGKYGAYRREEARALLGRFPKP